MEKNKIYLGNSLNVLKTFPDESIDLCVTSPPYYNLRNYGGDKEIWGGDENCDHEWGDSEPFNGSKPTHNKNKPLIKESDNSDWSSGSYCQRCGAWRGELGLEPTPELYIKHLTDIFREVRRVLKSTGTLWVNIGDSYAGSRKAGNPENEYYNKHTAFGKEEKDERKGNPTKSFTSLGIKPKDLIGIPWLLAFSLRSDGWYLRQDIIWAKAVSGDMRVGNAMPESVFDRNSKSHEYIFLFSKSPKYYYNQEAIKEPTKVRYQTGWNGNEKRDFVEGEQNHFSKFMGSDKAKNMDKGNRRSVWFVKTKPFGEAHFACVDKDTEILTEKGWKKYNQVGIGDKILSYNIDKNIIENDYIQDLYVNNNYSGDMVSVNKRDISMLLTPNHRVVYKKYRNQNQNYKIRRADSLRKSDVIPISSNYLEDGADNAKVTFNYPKLLGFFITDGYIETTKKNGQVCYIEQFCERGKDYLKFLDDTYDFVSLKYRFRDGKESIIAKFSNGVSQDIMKFIYNRRNPSFENIFNQPIDWLISFWEGAILGDGHTRKDDGRESLVKTEEIIDLLQGISVKLGKASKKTIRKDSNVAYNLFLTDKRNVSLRGTNSQDISAYQKISYKGTVWCPQTKNTTWIARRNGRVFITGNTFPENLIKPIIKAGVPDNVCLNCGSPYNLEIIKEEVNRDKLDCGYKDDRGVTRTTAGLKDLRKYGSKQIKDMKYKPSCDCNAGSEPGTVLDPFFGAGTTGVVAKKEGVNYIGIEKYQKYIDIAEKRIRDTMKKLF